MCTHDNRNNVKWLTLWSNAYASSSYVKHGNIAIETLATLKSAYIEENQSHCSLSLITRLDKTVEAYTVHLTQPQSTEGIISKARQGKLTRYMPWRCLGGQEEKLLLSLTSALDEGEWSGPRFTPGERTPGTYCTED
jgi:hypothetical protein